MFGHFSAIIVSANQIGENCTIFQGVSIGSVRGKGNPQIGDNVVFGANSTIVGDIKIGNNVFIGAGAVVTSDIPDNSVVVGNPGRIISNNGIYHTSKYIN